MWMDQTQVGDCHSKQAPSAKCKMKKLKKKIYTPMPKQIEEQSKINS
jgi:hypothetical protein